MGAVGTIVRSVAIGADGVAFATALTSFGMRRLRCGDGAGGHAGRDYSDLPEGP